LISDIIGRDLIGLKFSLKSDHSFDSKSFGDAVFINVNPLIDDLDNIPYRKSALSLLSALSQTIKPTDWIVFFVTRLYNFWYVANGILYAGLTNFFHQEQHMKKRGRIKIDPITIVKI
jgi:hypothetical protein